MDLLQRGAQLFEKINGVLDDFAGEKSARDAQVATAIAHMTGNSPIIKRIVLAYDNAKVFTKETYMVTTSGSPPVKSYVDDHGSAESDWYLVAPLKTGELSYFTEGSLGILDLYSAYSYLPGYYESPPYSNDKSNSLMQFCVANYNSTSGEINQRLAKLGFKLKKYGGWWTGASPAEIPVVQNDRHPYSSLFVRFVNHPYQTSDAPQPIARYGGNCNFSLNSLTVFPTIKYNEVVK